MPVVTLTFTKVGGEIIAGIPEFVEITSNIPSLIFYTLDGTLPTVFSQQYDGYAIRMPTDSGSVTLSAVGYTMDGYGNLVPGPVLSETYFTDGERIGEKVRNLFFEGITYISPGGLDIPFWYDSVGDPAVLIDIPVEDLVTQLKVSDRNEDGSKRDTGLFSDTELIPIDETTTTRDDPFKPFDTPEDSKFGTFDPEALFIVIDGREPRDLEDINLINSPYMSLRNPEGNYRGLDFYSTDGSNYVSGSLTKAHYNRTRNIIVFYYYDSNANRWVKSIQTLPDMEVDIPSNAIISNPVVFEWNNFGRHQNV